MSRTYTNLLTHAIFSTKDRQPLLAPALGKRLFPYMGGIVRKLDGVAILINGVVDHVHLLVSLPATLALSEFVSKLKSNSSRWVHETFPEHRLFAWQTGYSVFSVSASQKQSVLAYIAGQEEHHRKVSYKEEVIAFLKKHEIEYDERYVFE
jgi:REP element-mobilizing transposase RayT